MLPAPPHRPTSPIFARPTPSVLAFARLGRRLTLPLPLTILIVSIPGIIGSAYALRSTTSSITRTPALVFADQCALLPLARRGLLGAHVVTTLRDPPVWRDLASLITHSVVGFSFGVLAFSLVASIAGLAALPLWYWSWSRTASPRSGSGTRTR